MHERAISQVSWPSTLETIPMTVSRRGGVAQGCDAALEVEMAGAGHGGCELVKLWDLRHR